MRVLAGYAASLVVGLVLSFAVPHKAIRKVFRILVIATLVVPGLIFGGFLLVARWSAPPSVEQLTRDFPAKQADLEALVRMSDEDFVFSRIAPDFVDEASSSARYMANDPKTGLPKLRWDEYRNIFSRNRIKLGVERDSDRDAFVMVESVGILDAGHITGYVYCSDRVSNDPRRFYPCLLRQSSGGQHYRSEPDKDGYSFERISGRWFAYDAGPS